MKHNSLSVLAISTLLIGACSTDEPVDTAGPAALVDEEARITLDTLSTRPWLITGGDVLVEVAINGLDNPGQLQVLLGEQDITDQFVVVSPDRRQALLQGLPLGDIELTAALRGTNYSRGLTLTNYPLSGPIISGPHQAPFLCQSSDFELVTGELLGEAVDDDCAVPTRVDYVYWSDTDERFKPLQRLFDFVPPEDIGQITLPDVGSIPFIVRVETGTVNRAIYEVAMLHDPDQDEPTPWRRSAFWNGKLVYTHGGGCRSGWHQQGTSTGGVMRPGLFEQGYAVVSASLNVFGQNCNDLLASETHIMVKERFIERYGVPEYTLATGASGGSYQSHQTADNYPGVFDGIIVSASFPDVTSATIFTVADSRLLYHYFTEKNPGGFSLEQQRAIAGFGEWESIANLARGAARLDPTYDPLVDAETQGGELSHPALEARRYQDSQQDGIRATVYDHTINVYGPVDGLTLAQRPLDNVGVQYGLAALNAGMISTQQFIDLNRDIGGFDRDLNPVADRHRADAGARRRAIESGRVLYGGAGLASTPIIDYRTYRDDAPGGDIHMLVHQFSTRQRLLNANGHAFNHVMQVGGRWGFSEEEPDLRNLFLLMDEWVMAVKSDPTEEELAFKVISHKPADLTDACWIENEDEGEDESSRRRIDIEQTYTGDSECNQHYPAFPTPRHVAGAPLANDIVSCELRQLTRADYAVNFTPAEWSALNRVFAAGVCDWSQGDASQASHQGTWVSFGPSPINRLYK